MTPPRHPSRRDFLHLAALGALSLGERSLLRAESPVTLATEAMTRPGAFVPSVAMRHPLRRCPEVSASGLQLLAKPGTAQVGGGVAAEGWLLNGSLPSPLIRVRKGELFDVELVNQIPDPLILHWHGLTPPEGGDGHPRFAVNPGARYHYRFPLENRAGTYWYHSHTHHRVALHTQKGIAGMLIVEDDEEAALGLPTGEREIPLILQDRNLDARGRPVYAHPNIMEGHMGTEPFGNGILHPFLEVDSGRYRFRVLNGANARIFRLERSDGRPFTLVGNDGGLMDRPVSVTSVDVSPGERVDLLVDLDEVPVGESIMIWSRGFPLEGHIAELGGQNRHQVDLEMLELRVMEDGPKSPPLPATLLPVGGPDPAQASGTRRFDFTFDRDPLTRSMEAHSINGVRFEMGRIDEHVPFGATEIWSFVNDGWFPHPVHIHGTHFKVLSRTGGRGQVMPWEGGLKDTVLIQPNERVDVAISFTAHRGLFLLHCHNLEHEDAGMMLNIQVE
ncbi:MAG: multicopper oxidase family protein [Gemmatimonadota bacterium]